jgi:protein TonB
MSHDGILVVTFAVSLPMHLATLVVAGRVGGPSLAIEHAGSLHLLELDAAPSTPKAPPTAAVPRPDPTPAPSARARSVQSHSPSVAAIARAASVLVANPRNDEPVDLPSIITGDGRARGGVPSEKGKGDDPTTDGRPVVDDTRPGPPPHVTAAPAPPGRLAADRSRPVALAGGSSWRCPFPPEADADQIDRAVVDVQVSVQPDGHAGAVTIVSDPGHGFGRAARACAIAQRYEPAADRAGVPVAATTVVHVRFAR